MDIKEESSVITFPFFFFLKKIHFDRSVGHTRKGETQRKRIWWERMRLKARKQLGSYTNLGNNSDNKLVRESTKSLGVPKHIYKISFYKRG